MAIRLDQMPSNIRNEQTSNWTSIRLWRILTSSAGRQEQPLVPRFSRERKLRELSQSHTSHSDSCLWLGLSYTHHISAQPYRICSCRSIEFRKTTSHNSRYLPDLEVVRKQQSSNGAEWSSGESLEQVWPLLTSGRMGGGAEQEPQKTYCLTASSF